LLLVLSRPFESNLNSWKFALSSSSDVLSPHCDACEGSGADGYLTTTRHCDELLAFYPEPRRSSGFVVFPDVARNCSSL